MSTTEPFDTPVLLMVFNRPETTSAVMSSLRQIRPSRFYVAADGPRLGSPNDARLTAEARKVASRVEWDCELRTLFRAENMGAGAGVADAISWFFDQVAEGIILEDDCVPCQSFYEFCEELLGYYRTQANVMHISGNNFQYGRRRGRASYYFSTWTHSWGWATWRRAWRHYDHSRVPEEERSHVWDAHWKTTVAEQRGLAVIPNVNLVTNIGHGADATHTRGDARYAFLPTREMQFPLTHPTEMRADRAADTFTYYANIRRVRYLQLIWWYRLQDFLGLVPTRLGRLLRLLRGVRREGGA